MMVAVKCKRLRIWLGENGFVRIAKSQWLLLAREKLFNKG